jgi:hypothetical protein
MTSTIPGPVLTGNVDCWQEPAYTDGCWAINEMFLATALDHRITLADAWLDTPLAGEPRTSFNTYMRKYLDGTGGKTTLPRAQMTSIEYAADSTEKLTTWQNVIDPLQSYAEPFVYLRGHDVCDEIYLVYDPQTGQASCPGQWQQQCWPRIEAVLQSWPGARVQMTVDIQTSDMCGIAAAINGAGGKVLLIPVINYMDGKEDAHHPGDQHGAYATFLEHAGNEVWLYASCMSHGCAIGVTDPYFSGWAGYAIDVAGSQNRAMGWLCFLYNATGELYYETVASAEDSMG